MPPARPLLPLCKSEVARFGLQMPQSSSAMPHDNEKMPFDLGKAHHRKPGMARLVSIWRHLVPKALQIADHVPQIFHSSRQFAAQSTRLQPSSPHFALSKAHRREGMPHLEPCVELAGLEKGWGPWKCRESGRGYGLQALAGRAGSGKCREAEAEDNAVAAWRRAEGANRGTYRPSLRSDKRASRALAPPEGRGGSVIKTS